MDGKSPSQSDNHLGSAHIHANDCRNAISLESKDKFIIQENGPSHPRRQSSSKDESGILRRNEMRQDGTRQASHRVKKTVSFSSMPYEKKITSVVDCLSFMVRGTKLIKVRPNSRQYWRTFYLSADKAMIYWTPTSKKPEFARVAVSAIKEILIGKRTDVFRAKEASDLAEECAFSIVYGSGDNHGTLDLLSSSAEDANIWVTGLVSLLCANNGNENPDLESMTNDPNDRESWLRKRFYKAAAAYNEAHDSLSDEEVVKLVTDLCPVLPVNRVVQRIKEFQAVKVDECLTMDVSSFVEFYKELATRPEVYHLLIRYSNKEYMSVDDLISFLESEQGVSDVSREYAVSIIQQFEPSATCDRNSNPRLYIEGLERFLISDICDIFEPRHKSVCQDMTQPLTHYFVASSHNTYLVEDQLKGPSSTEGYIQALMSGCRFLEMDVWDGPGNEPVIFHGHTLTSRIPFRDAVISVRDYAFEKSQYPLILCIEVHCSLEQQLTMVQLINAFLGPVLLTDPVGPSVDVFPSPESLKNKIIILGRKLPQCVPVQSSSGEVTEDDESAESAKGRSTEKLTSPKRIHLAREFSDLVNYCRFHRFDSFAYSAKNHRFYDVLSMPECMATKLAHLTPEEFVRHTKKFLTRVYPSGMRVDSSNLNPQDMWNSGCQIVALNYQSVGLMMDWNMGRFSQNGACGYVLKPAVMREDFSVYSSNSKKILGITQQTLTIKVISALNLPKPTGAATKGDVIDPFVKLEISGIPADCCEYQTKTILNNGFNPVFDETFEFQLTFPELALLRFAVLDDDCIGDDFIGQYTIPIDCIQTGYRHVRLKSLYGKEIPNSYLFVHIAITNKKGGGRSSKSGVSGLLLRHRRPTESLKTIGIKAMDEIIRTTASAFKESMELKDNAENAILIFKAECGQQQTASMRQCVKVLIQRLSVLSAPGSSWNYILKNGYPEITFTSSSDAPRKILTAFENVIIHCRNVIENSERVVKSLESSRTALLELYEDFQFLSNQAGLREKKLTRGAEKFSWNIRLIRGHADLLSQTKKICQKSIKKICDSLTVGLSLEDS